MIGSGRRMPTKRLIIAALSFSTTTPQRATRRTLALVSEFSQRIAQMCLSVCRTHQPAPLQRWNQCVGDFSRIAPAVVAERALDQEAIAADFFYYITHFFGDGIRRTDQLD